MCIRDRVIASRLRAARVELARKMEYDVRLVNDDLDEAADELVRFVNEMCIRDRP